MKGAFSLFVCFFRQPIAGLLQVYAISIMKWEVNWLRRRELTDENGKWKKIEWMYVRMNGVLEFNKEEGRNDEK